MADKSERRTVAKKHVRTLAAHSTRKKLRNKSKGTKHQSVTKSWTKTKELILFILKKGGAMS